MENIEKKEVNTEDPRTIMYNNLVNIVGLGNPIQTLQYCQTFLEVYKDEDVYDCLFELYCNMKYDIIRDKEPRKYLDEALTHFPNSPTILNYKGIQLYKNFCCVQAIEVYKQAAEHCKNDIQKSSIYNNMAVAYTSIGMIDAALESLNTIVDLETHHTVPLEVLKMLRLYSIKPILGPTNQELMIKIVQNSMNGFPTDYDFKEKFNYKENEEIRIGYISGDFGDNNAVSKFTKPLFNNHSKKYRPYLYNTATSRNSYGVYSEYGVKDFTTEVILDLIASNKLDILVDLSGYTKGNRCDVLVALKNVSRIKTYSYAGYPDDTGLSVRISDNNTDKASENVVTMDRFFLCYDTERTSKCKNREAKLLFGPVSFGCYAKLDKINEDVIRVWKRLLDKNERHADSNNRIILRSRFFTEKDTVDLWTLKLNDPRFILCPHINDDNEYLESYNDFCVALDTWPYSGTTVTCDALAMNTPVITFYKEDSNHVSKVTYSLLKELGYTELIANSEDEYIDKAIKASVAGKKKYSDGKFKEYMNAGKFMKSFEKVLG